MFDHARHATKLTETVGAWKARAFEAEVPGRPLVWIDDHLPRGFATPADTTDDTTYWTADTDNGPVTAPALPIACHPNRGLTSHHQDQIRRFLDQHHP